MNELDDVKRLDDEELIRSVSHCVREDRRVSALLLAHLGELEARGLHRDLGYTSVFDYAVHGLQMSDSEAALRIYTARFARKFPAALAMLSRGELHLTAMKLLHPVLTDENTELLDLARLKTKQEIQTLIAKHCPQADVPGSIRRLPTARAAVRSEAKLDAELMPGQSELQIAPAMSLLPASSSLFGAGEQPPSTGVGPTSTRVDEPSAATVERTGSNDVLSSQITTARPHASQNMNPLSPLLHARRGVGGDARDRAHLGSWVTPRCNREPATPISEGRYKFQFTASQRVRDLMQEAQDLYRNQVPTGDIATIFERALELLVAERKKQRFAQMKRPHRSTAGNATRAAAAAKIRTKSVDAAAERKTSASVISKPNSRHVPNEVKRRVYARDQGRCRFVGVNGERCCARGRLEYHHIHAFGFGGRATEANIVLFCRAHNQLLAERDFNREHIERCIRARQAARSRRSLGSQPDAKIQRASFGDPSSSGPNKTTCSGPERKGAHA